MWPSAMWVTRAGTEKIATATRLEATADFIGTRNGPVSTGTITMPPPTPSRPATNPDAAPRATSSGKGCREPLAPPAVGPVPVGSWCSATNAVSVSDASVPSTASIHALRVFGSTTCSAPSSGTRR